MNIEFGELIRKARERNQWLGRELAARLEVDSATISRLEKGSFKDTPSPELMDRISSVLGISVASQLEALGYPIRVKPTSIAEATPVYDELAASIARTTATWTPAQKHLLWQYIESVSAALDERDRRADAERGQETTG